MLRTTIKSLPSKSVTVVIQSHAFDGFLAIGGIFDVLAGHRDASFARDRPSRTWWYRDIHLDVGAHHSHALPKRRVPVLSWVGRPAWMGGPFAGMLYGTQGFYGFEWSPFLATKVLVVSKMGSHYFASTIYGTIAVCRVRVLYRP